MPALLPGGSREVPGGFPGRSRGFPARVPQVPPLPREPRTGGFHRNRLRNRGANKAAPHWPSRPSQAANGSAAHCEVGAGAELRAGAGLGALAGHGAPAWIGLEKSSRVRVPARTEHRRTDHVQSVLKHFQGW